jgi:pimeloyl-ACP methyl ester carboxylesterase
MINGFRHYWEDHGSGEAIIMHHGARGSSLQFAEHIPAISERYRVIAPDARGLGRSEHVKDLPPSAWVDDTLGLVNHLGLDKVHIFGSSRGSRVGMRFAIDYPDRVRSVLVDGPIIAMSSGGNERLNRSGGKTDKLSAEEQEEQRRRHGEDWRDVFTNYHNIRNRPGLQEYYDLRNLIQKIQAPMLVMHGDTDDVTHPLADAYELHRRVPKARLAIVPNIGYSVNRSGGGRFARLVLEFLDIITGRLTIQENRFSE